MIEESSLAKRRKDLQAGSPIRVLVVDDSVVIRSLVPRALAADPALEVVGTAAHGRAALAKIPHLTPDVITLDIEMPQMDGLETLRHLRAAYPEIYVIMFSSLTESGAAATLDALTLGANDYVTKLTGENRMEGCIATLRAELVPKIKQFFLNAGAPQAKPQPKPETQPFPAFSHAALFSRSLVAIGVSTGGPAALSTIIPQFPEDFPAPILIVQHMPPVFTRMLAERLQKNTRLRVEEATEGATVEPGKVIIAAGDYHMKVRQQGGRVQIAVDQSAPRNFCRPSVDALFDSVAEVHGSGAIGVVMTGMGQDGLLGTQRLKSSGAYVIAQDQASSVVWGMPGFVARAGLADALLPLQELVPEIVKQTGAGRLS